MRVLVVDDSVVAREFLVHLLSSDPEVEVIGTAEDGVEAVEAAMRLKPDVITMDVHMPKMDGFEATLRIMESTPTPIVIVSGSTTAREVASSFRALEVGALAVVPRPKGLGDPEFETTVKELIQTVKLMSEVKVIRRHPRLQRKPVPSMVGGEVKPFPAEVKVVAVGGSTGGPLALQTILSGLPRNFPVPVLIVQHMSAGFVGGFVEWLARTSGFPTHIASDGEYPLPGHAYVAPDGFHMRVNPGNRIGLSDDEPRDGLRPSISHLFESVDRALGRNAVELKLMKDKGAVTIVQDKESSAVYGMPGEAIRLGAATSVLPLERIAPALISLVMEGRGGKP
jgi:two-component system chemotaxis response regulator CheB